MRKVASVFVSLGVILVIVGLVVVGIAGGDAIKNFSWNDLFSGRTHDLSAANGYIDKTLDELDGVKSITIDVDRYSVYVLPGETDVLTVKYVDPTESGVNIDVNVNKHVLNIIEADNLSSTWWFNNSIRFIAVYLPQTDAVTSLPLKIIGRTTGVRVKDVDGSRLTVDVDTGAVSLSNCNFGDVNITTDTGAVNVNNVYCNSLAINTGTGSVTVTDSTAEVAANIEVDTGSINFTSETDLLDIISDTGSVKFKTNARVIKIDSDTGSVSGTVLGHKSDYEITVRKDTGSSNLKSQHVENATRFLTIDVDTGSINVKFEKD